MAAFAAAAESPDRDDDELERLEWPAVECADCGTDLGTHPVGVYVDCEECGGFTLARHPPPPYEPTDADFTAMATQLAQADAQAGWEEAERQRERADGLATELAAATTAAGLTDAAIGAPLPDMGPLGPLAAWDAAERERRGSKAGEGP